MQMCAKFETQTEQAFTGLANSVLIHCQVLKQSSTLLNGAAHAVCDHGHSCSAQGQGNCTAIEEGAFAKQGQHLTKGAFSQSWPASCNMSPSTPA